MKALIVLSLVVLLSSCASDEEDEKTQKVSKPNFRWAEWGYSFDQVKSSEKESKDPKKGQWLGYETLFYSGPISNFEDSCIAYIFYEEKLFAGIYIIEHDPKNDKSPQRYEFDFILAELKGKYGEPRLVKKNGRVLTIKKDDKLVLPRDIRLLAHLGKAFQSNNSQAYGFLSDKSYIEASFLLSDNDVKNKIVLYYYALNHSEFTAASKADIRLKL